MEVILTRDVEKVGHRGDVVRVKDGFARNFLIPRSLALPATRSNREFVEDQRRRSETRKAKEREAAQETAKRVAEEKFVLEARAGDKDKLFGAITAEDIRESLNQKGYTVDKKHILIQDAIRSLGTHSVQVELCPGVRTQITIEVVRAS